MHFDRKSMLIQPSIPQINIAHKGQTISSFIKTVSEM